MDKTYSNIKLINILTHDFIEQLVEILNTDSVLRSVLSGNMNKVTESEFVEHNSKWSHKTNSEIFVITLHNIAIGTISLSHQNENEGSARVGYWISSMYWGRGYTTEAFAQLIEIARKKEIRSLRAKIRKDNRASIKIWQKYNAEIEEIEKDIFIYLEIK